MENFEKQMFDPAFEQQEDVLIEETYDFGMSDSHTKRIECFDVASKADPMMPKSAHNTLLMMAARVKSQPRILTELVGRKDKWQNYDWYKPLLSFVRDKLVHYNAQAVKGLKFPMVCFNGASPSGIIHYKRKFLVSLINRNGPMTNEQKINYMLSDLTFAQTSTRSSRTLIRIRTYLNKGRDVKRVLCDAAT